MPFDDASARPKVKVANQRELALIDKMLELLRTPRQWIKGSPYSNGRYCLIGAFGKAKYGDPYVYEYFAGRDRVWKRLTKINGRNLILFNDATGTRHRDVVSLLRRVRASFE